MKRLAFGLVMTFLGSLLMVVTAGADNGPHGNYSATTDKCAACHRAHTAVGDSLLIGQATANNKSEFCYTCHSGGAGAYTDVMNGVFNVNLATPPPNEYTVLPYDPDTNALLGGGFVRAKMNIALTGTLDLPVTSSHMVSGGSNTVWGYGPSSGQRNVGALAVSLTCTNCHNPHGGAGENNGRTFRILKGKSGNNSPLFTNTTTSVSSNVDVMEESDPIAYYFQETWVANTYFGAHTWSANDGSVPYGKLTKWCSQCHQRYVAPWNQPEGSPANTDSHDAVFGFRHPTGNPADTGCNHCHPGMYPEGGPEYVPGCMTCHVAHGTGARQGVYGGEVEWPGDPLREPSGPSGSGRSALLRLDGRGVCMRCHNDSGTIVKGPVVVPIGY